MQSDTDPVQSAHRIHATIYHTQLTTAMFKKFPTFRHHGHGGGGVWVNNIWRLLPTLGAHPLHHTKHRPHKLRAVELFPKMAQNN